LPDLLGESTEEPEVTAGAIFRALLDAGEIRVIALVIGPEPSELSGEHARFGVIRVTQPATLYGMGRLKDALRALAV
jgi:hypothetical protein